jgi:hypothetical protein
MQESKVRIFRIGNAQVHHPAVKEWFEKNQNLSDPSPEDGLIVQGVVATTFENLSTTDARLRVSGMQRSSTSTYFLSTSMLGFIKAQFSTILQVFFVATGYICDTLNSLRLFQSTRRRLS